MNNSWEPRAVRYLMLVGLLLASPVFAAKKTSKTPSPNTNEHTFALVLIAKDKPNQKLFGAIADELSNAPKSLGNLRLITSTKLKKSLGKTPESATLACSNDAKCLAKLGKKAQVEGMVVAKVLAKGPNVSLVVMVIDVANAKTTDLLSFPIASLADVHTVVNDNLRRIFPISTEPAAPTGTPDIDELPLDLIMPSPAAPAPPSVATTTKPAPTTNDDDELPLELIATATPQAATATTPNATPSSDLDLALAPLTTSPTNLPASGPLSPSPELQASSTTSWLTYAGIGCATAGALVAGAGGYFGWQGRSTAATLNSQTPQLVAAQKVNDANDHYDRAELLGEAGGALLLVGAALLALDWAVTDSHTPTPAVSVGSSATTATLTWRYE